MPREASPYIKNSNYVTSIDGVPHRVLCPVHMGMPQAKNCLRRLQVMIEDAKHKGINPADVSLEHGMPAAGSNPPGVTYPSVVARARPFHGPRQERRL